MDKSAILDHLFNQFVSTTHADRHLWGDKYLATLDECGIPRSDVRPPEYGRTARSSKTLHLESHLTRLAEENERLLVENAMLKAKVVPKAKRISQSKRPNEGHLRILRQLKEHGRLSTFQLTERFPSTKSRNPVQYQVSELANAFPEPLITMVKLKDESSSHIKHYHEITAAGLKWVTK
jgi:hypothetical protein